MSSWRALLPNGRTADRAPSWPRWAAGEFSVFGRDRVDAEGGRPGETAEQDEIEAKVQQLHQGAELATRAERVDLPRHGERGAACTGQETTAQQPPPRDRPRCDVGKNQGADQSAVAADADRLHE